MEILLNELKFTNIKFWIFQIATQYNNIHGYGEELAGDIIEEVLGYDNEWANKFTQYYEGVIDDHDGYIDSPTFVKIKVSSTDEYKIEFHPGDTLYYKNGKEFASTGPHFTEPLLPFSEIEPLLNIENGHVIFFLLLPIIKLSVEEQKSVSPIIIKNLMSLGLEKEPAYEITLCMFEQLEDCNE